MNRPVVFIHTNAKQLIGAKVAAHALKRSSSAADHFDIQLLKLDDYPALHGREGQTYLRHGKPAVWQNDDLQSFTPLRFLPPSKMGFCGRALVIDPDVFALADVMELLTMDMQGKAIMCRHVSPGDGRKPYWASSVMLLDCQKLAHWRWEQCLEEMFSFRRDYRDWMSLWLENESTIGILGDEWNHYDLLNSQTKMLHNTGRLTQPWKTGLPVDFSSDTFFKRSLPSSLLHVLMACLRSVLGKRRDPVTQLNQTYQRHPDLRQEKLFFSLLQECIDAGLITHDELRVGIERNYIRKDAFAILEDIQQPEVT